jgi:hypothetical protein
MLERLVLDLRHNPVRDSGTEALVALQDAAAFEILTVEVTLALWRQESPGAGGSSPALNCNPESKLQRGDFSGRCQCPSRSEGGAMPVRSKPCLWLRSRPCAWDPVQVSGASDMPRH